MKNPRQKIVDIARTYLGTREVTPNRGPHLSEFWKDTSYPDGEKDRQPWCSAFASHCVHEADRQSEELQLPLPPTFPAVAQWLPWAKRSNVGCLVFSAEDVLSGRRKPLAGDVLVFLPHFSHVGIVAEDYSTGSKVRTIEGNTNGAGSREGDGVYEKDRALSICGTFIRIPAVGERLT